MLGLSNQVPTNHHCVTCQTDDDQMQPKQSFCEGEFPCEEIAYQCFVSLLSIQNDAEGNPRRLKIYIRCYLSVLTPSTRLRSSRSF